MAAYSYLAHDDPAPPVGRTVAQRLDACGYPSGAAGWGENIAYYYPDAASVMAAWLGDAGHKANLENPSWKTIGVGVARSGSGPIYRTQDFGTTGASSPPSAAAPQADTQPPTVPGGLGLSASGPTLNVSWQPSSDDVGVAGYDIFLTATVWASCRPRPGRSPARRVERPTQSESTRSTRQGITRPSPRRRPRRPRAHPHRLRNPSPNR